MAHVYFVLSWVTVEQVKVAESVFDFLRGGVFKHLCRGFITLRAGDFREVAVLDVRHRLAGEGGFDVFEGDRFGFHIASPG